MKFRYVAVTAASFATAFAANVIAQSAAPAPIVEPALTKHNCTKPEIPDASKKLGAERMNLFIAGFNAYKECVSDFALAQKKVAEQQQSIAQATIASANAAVKEYNDFAEVANKVNAPKDETQQKRANDDATRGGIEPKQVFKAPPAPK